MTRPYDVEQGLRELAESRAFPSGHLIMSAARLGDFTADVFRADFDMALDLEEAGKALVALAAHLVALAQQQPDVTRTMLINAVGFAGENLVRTARVRAAEAGDVEGVLCEHVLTWHPIAADPVDPIEVPLYEAIAWNPEELGEFRVSTREVPTPAGEATEVSGA